jgi:hypothetical protein
LSPSAPTVEAIVASIDAVLEKNHKDYLKCFRSEDELVARAASQARTS